ncbi:MAG: pectate lyase [Planctomycetota bacterium]|jgi:PelA/Pel-15E family pectate lyase
MKKHGTLVAVCTLVFLFGSDILSCDNVHADLREQAAATMRKAASFFRTKVASHGGYVYYYSLDLQKRWGEGAATADQIWVQPPGTPTVGMAYLKAYEATSDRFYLDAATEAAEALIYGQLQSGGWTNCIDFDPHGRVAQYRNGRGQGKNNSSLDDGQTQSAIQLLVLADRAFRFEHKKIHESALFALDALLVAQFPNGAFPQVWTGPVERQPVMKASYPDYDWRIEGRIKNYWNMYTLNDDVPGYVTQTLIDAYLVYADEKYEASLRRLGDFLLLARMPDPQPAWAQQYNYEMNPIWARKFEPPGISGDESQEVIETLMDIYTATGDHKYLEPISRALAYLKRSLLPDGRLARFYELKTNKPLYMSRRGDVYTLTYDDSSLPSHYGWKVDSRLNDIEARYNRLKRGTTATTVSQSAADLEQRVRQIIENLDGQGRWLSTYRGERLVGQPKFRLNTLYIVSEVFSRNIETLSEYLMSTHKN